MKLKIGLRLWLTLSVILPCLLVAVLLGGYFNYHRQQAMADELHGHAANIALPLAVSSQKLLNAQLDQHVLSLLEQTHRLNSPLVTSIALFNQDKTLRFSSNPQQNLQELVLQHPFPEQLQYLQARGQLLAFQPLISDKALLTSSTGFLVISLDQQQLALEQQVGLLHTVLIIFAVLVLALVLAFWLVQQFLQAQRRVRRQSQQLLDGDYRLKSYPQPINELALLQDNMLLLAKRLNTLEQDMQQNIELVTSDLQQSMEQLEIQNIQLEFARRKAQEENRQKSDFLAKMSHELRTPLNAVIGFTRQLLKTSLSLSQIDYLHTIQKSANSLLNLVNDVLDFSRLEEGRLAINTEPVSLRDVMNDSVELLAASAFEKQLELVLMIEPDCPDELLLDPARLTQVLLNITGNAIKFTEHGSILIQVRATTLSEEHVNLHISVKDTGRGISEEKQNRLFDGHAITEQHEQQTGSGLGLIICKRLVQAMQGNIGFESKLGEGSTFWFTIKCQKHQLSISDDSSQPLLENKTILYFEPQQYSRDATIQLLHAWGMQVTACATKKQLQQALQQHYDIGLIGRAIAINQVNEIISLVQQLKLNCEHVYLLVNTLSPNLREVLLRSGAAACLPKPAHSRKLAMTLAEPYQIKTADEQSLLPKLSTLKILTVDDNQANLKLINTLLAELAQDVDSAFDGAEAWRKSTQHVYDIIFMDINMPIMDGVQSCQRIRQSSLNEHTPIIAVTAHAVDGERERLLGLGFDEFLTKPLDEKMLYFTLQEFCKTTKQPSLKAALLPAPTPLVDWDAALQRAAGKVDLAHDMLNMLLQSLPQTQKQISLALAENEPQMLLHTLHKLHGACCYTGVPRLKNLLEILETQLKKGVAIRTLEPELSELEDVLEQLQQAEFSLADFQE